MADSPTGYVCDGREMVAQTVIAAVAGETVSLAFLDAGEQMDEWKGSGFAYNAQAYDASIGMSSLRTRQYEPGREQVLAEGNISRAINFTNIGEVLSADYLGETNLPPEKHGCNV